VSVDNIVMSGLAAASLTIGLARSWILSYYGY
jgi:hypothetical protein